MEKQVQNYLETHIPLSLAMGIQVEKASLSEIRLFVPLAPNINHKSTVFGGSLAAACTLACWCLLYVNLPRTFEVVVARSEIDYLKPVRGDFVATCSHLDFERFLNTLKKRKKARIQLSASIQDCCTFSGAFAAIETIHP